MHTNVSPIADITLRPGDVVLTALAGPLSTLMQRIAKAPVSHAGMMITGDIALEARDSHLELCETTGRAWWVTLDELINHDSIDYIAIRRPPASLLDVQRLHAWAVRAGVGDVPFASAGLTMMGALKVYSHAEARVLGNKLHSQPLGRIAARVRRERRDLAEAIADGPSRLICAELVCRGLHAAGVDLDLEHAEFGAALGDLPHIAPLEIVPSPGDPERIEEMAERRDLTPGPITSAPERRPRLRRAAANFRNRWTARHGEPNTGDRADLVTPRDLLTLAPLTTVATFERRGDEWIRVDQ